MKMKLTKEQRTVLNQHMQQSMQLLQMNSHELEQYINDLSMENPLIEVVPPREQPTQPNERAYSRPHTVDPDVISRTISDAQPNTLHGAVREQINYMRIPELLRRELLWLAEELDERGYLPAQEPDLHAFGNSPERYRNAVAVFQTLEPAGVGARDLGECLCLQIRRKNGGDELAESICRSYLDRLAKGQLNYIAAQLGVNVRQVSRAKELIATLEPNPSNGFHGTERTVYVRPDIEIIHDTSGLVAAPADRYMPTYGIDGFYLAMSQRSDLSEQEREYFKEKLAQARWAMNCVDRRRSMLCTCAQAVLDEQRAFFTDGVSPIKPFTMVELANRLGVHTSTVSRAVRGKYIACQWGVFPLADFFRQEVGAGEELTVDRVTEQIKALIAQEDPKNPLSDKAIAEALENQGVSVSRRTVAKYREAAMIPSTAGRRQR